MIFYMLEPRESYSGVEEIAYEGSVKVPGVKPVYLEICTKLAEYKDRRIKTRWGDFCGSGSGYFFHKKCLPLLSKSTNGKVIVRPVEVVDKEGADFYQVWVSNIVNCLDLKESTLSDPYDWWARKTGIIRKAVINESKWDGSDLFIFPQDPLYQWFCTERFVNEWRDSGFKGMEFSVRRLDMNSIKC